MRKTELKKATTGVVITILSVIVLMGIIRASKVSQADAASSPGAALFVEKGCAHCHHTDSNERKMGPVLKDLFAMDELPVSGRPVNEKNIIKQIEQPYRNMPSFAGGLTEQEMGLLVSYLKTL